MTWVKIDDQMPRHPKTWRLSDGAFRLHIAGLCHAAAYATDGHIDEAYLHSLTPTPRRARAHADELVSAGVWEKVPTGFCVHDYLDYQLSAAQVEAQRKATRERVKAWRSDHRNANRNGKEAL